jgi:hypothetical protein
MTAEGLFKQWTSLDQEASSGFRCRWLMVLDYQASMFTTESLVNEVYVEKAGLKELNGSIDQRPH